MGGKSIGKQILFVSPVWWLVVRLLGTGDGERERESRVFTNAEALRSYSSGGEATAAVEALAVEETERGLGI